MEGFTNKQILLIDDEVSVRYVVQVCLETFGGWDVLLAASGQEGLAIAKAQQPDAILLDGTMPEMDGVTFLSKLRADPEICSIPVIFLTARMSLLEPHQFAAIGAKGAIAKPFEPLVLATQIAEILGWDSNPELGT